MPDIYAIDIFDWTCNNYYSKKNLLFIPETKCLPDAAVRAFYTFGKYGVLGYSPFGVEGNGITNMRSPATNLSPTPMAY